MDARSASAPAFEHHVWLWLFAVLAGAAALLLVLPSWSRSGDTPTVAQAVTLFALFAGLASGAAVAALRYREFQPARGKILLTLLAVGALTWVLLLIAAVTGADHFLLSRFVRFRVAAISLVVLIAIVVSWRRRGDASVVPAAAAGAGAARASLIAIRVMGLVITITAIYAFTVGTSSGSHRVDTATYSLQIPKTFNLGEGGAYVNGRPVTIQIGSGEIPPARVTRTVPKPLLVERPDGARVTVFGRRHLVRLACTAPTARLRKQAIETCRKTASTVRVKL